jgi:hypothetical protein
MLASILHHGGTSMQVVDFYPTKFNDIPNQDNPAFDATEECVVVCADAAIGNRVMVLHIIPDPVESVNRVAMFWKHDIALKFAGMYSEMCE